MSNQANPNNLANAQQIFANNVNTLMSMGFSQ